MKTILFALLFALPAAAEPIIAVDRAELPKEMPTNAISDPRAKVIQEAIQEDETPATIGLVLDSSGSMGAILEKNRTKMYFMKQIMKGFLGSQWKLKNKVGVRVYGGRVKNKCDDIELAIPYTDKSLAKLEKSLEKMAPVGMTPLHKSIEMSVDEIKNVKGPKRIVIVTDGEDTCGGDPCKTADKIREDKLDIKFFVVALGFQGESDKLKKLQCLGDVAVAQDGDSFSDAMSQASSKSRGSDNLKVVSPNPDAIVYLYKVAEDGKRTLDRVFYARSPQRVEPGTYDAIVGLQPPYKFEGFNILPGRRVTLKVEGEGKVRVNYFNSLLNAQLLDKNNKVVMKFKSDTDATAPIGKWKLRVYKDPFFEILIPDYFVYPNGDHKYDVAGAAAFRVDSGQLSGLYVYDQDNVLLGHSLTDTTLVIKGGMYTIHRDDKCSFEKTALREKKEVLVLDCTGR